MILVLKEVFKILLMLKNSLKLLIWYRRSLVAKEYVKYNRNVKIN